MSRWRITFTNGDQEETSELADKLRVDVDGQILRALASRTYGADETIAVYPIANIRKWEAIR